MDWQLRQFLIFLGIPAIISFLLSFQAYSPVSGIFGSAFVGLENFSSLFQSFAFPQLVRNALVQTLLGAFLPLIPALFAGWGAAQMRSRRLCFGLAGILLLPDVSAGHYICVFSVSGSAF